MLFIIKRKFLTCGLSIVLLSLASCSDGASTTADEGNDGGDDETTTTSEAIVTSGLESTYGLLSTLTDSNLSPDIAAELTVTSVEGANCAYSLTGISGMDLSQNGPAATFGPEEDSIPLSTSDYCGQGGDWTAYSFNGLQAANVQCVGKEPVSVISGTGVFRVSNGSVDFYGTFIIQLSDSDIVDLNCHYVFEDSGAATATCALEFNDIPVVTLSAASPSCELEGVTDTEIEQVATQENNYLFPTSDTGGSDFGGREGGDFFCRVTAASDYPDLECLNGVRAFISVNDTDEIRDMPDNYGVDSSLPILNAENDETVASDWSNLLDGNIDSALSVSWWSGSTTAGAVADGYDSTCDGWESTTGIGFTGTEGATDDFWIQGSDGECSGTAHLMCLCY